MLSNLQRHGDLLEGQKVGMQSQDPGSPQHLDPSSTPSKLQQLKDLFEQQKAGTPAETPEGSPLHLELLSTPSKFHQLGDLLQRQKARTMVKAPGIPPHPEPSSMLSNNQRHGDLLEGQKVGMPSQDPGSPQPLEPSSMPSKLQRLKDLFEQRKAGTPAQGQGSPQHLEPSSTPSKLQQLKDLLEQRKAGTPAQRGTAPGLLPEAPSGHPQGSPTVGSSPQESLVARSSGHCKIRRGKLPALGQRTHVVVVGANIREKTLYVQELGVQDELLAMMRALNQAVLEDPQPLDHCPLGHFVAAPREDEQTWYRARVFKVNSGDTAVGAAKQGDSATVFYIDYGRWGTVPLDGLRRLPESLMDKRAFAVPVLLYNVPTLPARAAALLQGNNVEAQVVVDERRQQVALFTVDDNACLNDAISGFGH